MPNVHANGIDIEYEQLGEVGAEPLLLIMGFSRQLIAWPDAFCSALVSHGFRVIRYDNRDVGLSSMIRDSDRGDSSAAPYTVDDMADDAAGLLSALDITAAHIVGASMGGMIAQSLAIRHPEMVLSLTSIMSSTGDPSVMRSDPEVMRALAAPPAADREMAIGRAVSIALLIGSKGLVNEERARDVAARSWDRNPAHDGVERQRLAIASSGDRTEALHRLSVPALVIHGEDDPLVSVSAGVATAAAIPGARLLTIPGMGHDLPEALWPQIIDAIVGITRRSAAAPALTS